MAYFRRFSSCLYIITVSCILLKGHESLIFFSSTHNRKYLQFLHLWRLLFLRQQPIITKQTVREAYRYRKPPNYHYTLSVIVGRLKRCVCVCVYFSIIHKTAAPTERNACTHYLCPPTYKYHLLGIPAITMAHIICPRQNF